MSFEIYKRLCGNFVNNGFEVVKRENSGYCVFFRRIGSVDVFTAVMREDALGDADELFKKICEHRQNERLIFMALCIAKAEDGELYELWSSDDFSADDECVFLKWIIDEKNKRLVVNGSQPKKMFSIEKIIEKSFDENTAVVCETERRTEIPYFTYLTMLIYAVVFVLMELNGGSENTETVIAFGAILGSKIYSGEIYRLFTAMFVHIGFMHLFSNVFSLYIMGSRVERYMGSLFFVCCYIFSGLCGSLGALLFSPESVTAGGSGAIFGIEGAVAVYTMIKKKPMDGINYYTALLFTMWGLAFGFMLPNVSNIGHICGLIGGVVFSVVYMKRGKTNENYK